MTFEPGIFAKTYHRPTLEGALDAVAASGMRCVQFNMACAGLPSMPDRIEPALAERVRAGFATRALEMGAVSGTCNLIHPDLARRKADVERLRGLIEACAGLGTQRVTLCTGTRDPENMWHIHTDNGLPEAWADLRVSLEAVLPLAEERGVTLLVEPELSNVINSPAKAVRLIEEMGSPALRVVIDAANLFHAADLPRMAEILHEACDLLGPWSVMAHAKDVSAAGQIVPAGQGVLDYPLLLRELLRAGYTGPLVLHGLDENEVPASLAFLQAARAGIKD